MSTNAITWTMPSGKTYSYEPFPIGTKFASIAGNYIFAKQGQDMRWYAVYIGQTNDLGERLTNHPKQACAVKNGATHILVKTNTSKALREGEEADMISLCQPVCNDLLK